MISPQGHKTHPQRYGEELRHPEGTWSTSTVALPRKKPVGVIRASDQDASLAPPFGGVQPLGDPRVNPEHTGGILYLIQPINTSVSPRRSWKTFLGRDIYTLLSLLPLRLRKWMVGWMDGWLMMKQNAVHKPNFSHQRPKFFFVCMYCTVGLQDWW